MQGNESLGFLARSLRDEFQTRLAALLQEAGLTEDVCVAQARQIIRMTEPDSLDLWAIYLLLNNAGNLRALVEGAMGRPINRLLIAPVPSYLEPLIPLFESQFPTVILCDNYKIGKQIANCPPVVSLDEALNAPDSYDCALIGTVDQRIRAIFAKRLPIENTINFYDVLESVEITNEASLKYAQEIEQEIRSLRNPFIILCHRFTPPYISTLQALSNAGYDVVVLSRFKDNAGLGQRLMDIRALGAAAVYPANLVQGLYLGRALKDCPWWLLNDGFLHASWSFERATWHYAYTAALLEMIEAPRILCLYDPIKPANLDYEYEGLALKTYAAAIRRADGVHFGCASQYLVDFIMRATGGTCPAIAFLRYNLPPKKPRPPRTENFSLALVSPIANEVSDPGTDLRDTIRILLQQGIDLHYYTGSPDSEVFKNNLPAEEAKHLFLHRQIIDQAALVQEISQCHAGWCVANLHVFDEIVSAMQTPEARDLYSLFCRETVPSRALAFGAAGLPVIHNSILHEVNELFPEGCAIPFDFSQAKFLGDILRQQDWPAMWAQMDAAAASFDIAFHFHRFTDFIAQTETYARRRQSGEAMTTKEFIQV